MEALRRTTELNPNSTITPALRDWELVLIDWKETLRNEDRSKATIDLYAGTVKQFFQHLDERMGLTIDLEHITREHVGHYLSWIRENSAPATQRIRFIALRRFFAFAIGVADVQMRHPMEKLKPVTVPERVVPAPSEEDVQAAIATCDTKTLMGSRDAALLWFLARSGLRIGEALSLNVGDINLDTGIFSVIGKGNRERPVRIDPTTRQMLSRYLRLAGKVRQNTPDAPLWVSRRRGGRLSVQAARRAIEGAGERAGVVLRPHLLRHHFGTKSAKEGMPEEALMTLMGHKSAQMTRRYAASERTERALAWHEKVFPGDKP